MVTSVLDDLQKLPPQAISIIRFLAGCDGAATSEIARHADLSERAFGKAIRALVTRRFAEMPQPGVYRLSARGREALDHLEPVPAAQPAPAPVNPAPLEIPATAERRLSVLVAQEWVRHLPAKLMAGFDAAPGPRLDTAPDAAQDVVLRVQAPGCLVEPDEHTLAVPARRPAGPVQFRLTPHEGQQIRVRVEVYRDAALLGGLVFDVPVNDLPSPRSAQFHALGAPVRLDRAPGRPRA